MKREQEKIDAAKRNMEKKMNIFYALCKEKARIEILMDAARAELDEAEFVLTCLEAGQDPEKVAIEKAEKEGVGE